MVDIVRWGRAGDGRVSSVLVFQSIRLFGVISSRGARHPLGIHYSSAAAVSVGWVVHVAETVVSRYSNLMIYGPTQIFATPLHNSISCPQ